MTQASIPATAAEWPAPDREQIRQFLRLLGKPGQSCHLRALLHKNHPRKPTDGGRNGIGRDGALQQIKAWQREGRNVYLVIGNGGTKNESITSCPAFFIEHDDRPKDWQVTAWRELGLPEPTVQVDTGGRSVHSYWVLHEPMDPQAWKEIQVRLFTHAQSDKLKDPARVMRLPGCWYMNGEGQPDGMARIITSAGHRYSPDQIEACLPPPPPEPLPRPKAPITLPAGHLPRHGDARPLQEVMDGLERIPAILPDNGQREQFRSLAWGLLCAVREAGSDDAMARQLLEAHSPQVPDTATYFETEPHSITAATFWKMAREHGWRPEAERRQEPLRDAAASPPADAPAGGRFKPRADSTARWGERKLNHSRAMVCFDRCVEVQAARQRNSLRRRARLLKAAADLGIAKYVNRQEISQRVLEAKDQQEGRCFAALSAADRLAMERPRVEWLIPGLIPANDMSIIGGRAKVGKTRLAVAIAAALLNGTDLFDLGAPSPRDVVLVSDDQADGDTADMLEALSLWAHPRLAWSRHFRLTENDLEALLQTIRATPGALVILDSLRSISRSLQHGENDPELGVMLYDLKGAVTEAGGTLLLIHHCNKAEGLIGVEALSGHNAIAGAANGILTLHYMPDDKGRPRKDDPQRRLVREARSGQALDLVVSPLAGSGTFYRVGTFADWQKQQEESKAEQKASSKLTNDQERALEVLNTSGGWLTRRQVCDEMGVDWGDRGRNPDAQRITRALRRLVELGLADSERAGLEATWKASHGTQLGESVMTAMPSSDGKGFHGITQVMPCDDSDAQKPDQESAASLSSPARIAETAGHDREASASSLIRQGRDPLPSPEPSQADLDQQAIAAARARLAAADAARSGLFDPAA